MKIDRYTIAKTSVSVLHRIASRSYKPSRIRWTSSRSIHADKTVPRHKELVILTYKAPRRMSFLSTLRSHRTRRQSYDAATCWPPYVGMLGKKSLLIIFYFLPALITLKTRPHVWGDFLPIIIYISQVYWWEVALQPHSLSVAYPSPPSSKKEGNLARVRTMACHLRNQSWRPTVPTKDFIHAFSEMLLILTRSFRFAALKCPPSDVFIFWCGRFMRR